MEQIKPVLDRYFDSLHNKNWEAFADCLTENFTYFTDNCGLQNKQQFVDFLTKDAWQPIEHQLSDLQVNMNDNLAIARYKMRFQGIDGRSKSEMVVWALETTVFAKQGDEWKITHSHTSNKV